MTTKVWIEGEIAESDLKRPVKAFATSSAKTPLQFKELFTPAERKAMRTIAKHNADVEDALDLLNAATEVKITDPRTQAGLASFVALGVITAARKAEIEAAFT